MTRSHYILFFALLFLISCGDDDPPPSRFDLLTRTDWQAVAIVIDGDFSETTDCIADDHWRFLKNGTLEVYDRSVKCHISNPQVLLMQWTISSNEEYFFFGFELDTPFEILELTPTSFRIKLDNGDPDSIEYEFEPVDN